MLFLKLKNPLLENCQENLSFLKLIKKKNNLEYKFLVREGDEFCWQFSNKGYFNFKSNIPKIIQKFI